MWDSESRMKRHQHQVELYPTSLRIWPAGPQVFQNGSLLTLLRQQLLRRPLRRQHGQLCLDHLQLLLNHWMLLGSIYGIVSCNANLKSQRQHTKKSKFTCSKRCRKFDSGSGNCFFPFSIFVAVLVITVISAPLVRRIYRFWYFLFPWSYFQLQFFLQ